MNYKHQDNSTKKLLYSIGDDPHLYLEEVKGKKYMEYRKQWTETGTFNVETNYPTQVDFELNPSCNLKCPMCTWSAVETFGQGKESWMPFDKYKKIIDEIHEKVMSVNLNYVNEPLIRKDIVDFVKYASDKGIMEVMFNTNGTLLTKELSEKLILSGITKLSFSLDAFTKKTYDKIRIGSNFDKVMKNIDDFLKVRKKLKKKVPLFKVTFLKVLENKNELKPFLKYWEKKADLISIQNPNNPFAQKKFNGELINEKLKKKREKWLDIESEKKNLIKTKKISNEYEFDNLKRCSQPNQRLVIDSDGAVHPCCNFRGKDITVGNAFKESIYSIWNNKKYKYLRKIHKSGKYYKHKVCKECLDYSTIEAPKI